MAGVSKRHCWHVFLPAQRWSPMKTKPQPDPSPTRKEDNSAEQNAKEVKEVERSPYGTARGWKMRLEQIACCWRLKQLHSFLSLVNSGGSKGG